MGSARTDRVAKVGPPGREPLGAARVALLAVYCIARGGLLRLAQRRHWTRSTPRSRWRCWRPRLAAPLGLLLQIFVTRRLAVRTDAPAAAGLSVDVLRHRSRPARRHGAADADRRAQHGLPAPDLAGGRRPPPGGARFSRPNCAFTTSSAPWMRARAPAGAELRVAPFASGLRGPVRCARCAGAQLPRRDAGALSRPAHGLRADTARRVQPGQLRPSPQSPRAGGLERPHAVLARPAAGQGLRQRSTALRLLRDRAPHRARRDRRLRGCDRCTGVAYFAAVPQGGVALGLPRPHACVRDGARVRRSVRGSVPASRSGRNAGVAARAHSAVGPALRSAEGRLPAHGPRLLRRLAQVGLLPCAGGHPDHRRTAVCGAGGGVHRRVRRIPPARILAAARKRGGATRNVLRDEQYHMASFRGIHRRRPCGAAAFHRGGAIALCFCRPRAPQCRGHLALRAAAGRIAVRLRPRHSRRRRAALSRRPPGARRPGRRGGLGRVERAPLPPRAFLQPRGSRHSGAATTASASPFQRGCTSATTVRCWASSTMCRRRASSSTDRCRAPRRRLALYRRSVPAGRHDAVRGDRRAESWRRATGT